MKEIKFVFPAAAKGLIEGNDAVRENFVTEETAGHKHRCFVDPATGNGWTDYCLGHGHQVVNQGIQECSESYDYSKEADADGKYPILCEGHSHKMGEKVERLWDEATEKPIFDYVCEECDPVYSDEEALEGQLFMDESYEGLCDELKLADAKLPTAQRKDLPATTFCGPGRSFPVNDCAHYTAALRLLSRYKGSSATKAKIHACIISKGKTLKCGAKEDAVTEPLPLDSILLRDDVKDYVKKLTDSHEASLADVKKRVEELTKLVAELEASGKKNKDDLDKATTDLKKAQEDLAASQTKVDQANEDKIALVSQNTQLYKNYKAALADQLIATAQHTNAGSVAEMLVLNADEKLEDKITKVRKQLLDETAEALRSKLVAPATKVNLQPLAPSEFGDSAQQKTGKTAGEEQPLDKKIATVYSK